MKSHTAQYLKEYTPPAFLVDQVDLIFDIQKDKTLVTSTLKIRKNKAVTHKNVSLDLDTGLYEIQSVVADGMVLLPHEYMADGEHFQLAKTPEQFSLEIGVLLYPEKNTTLEGLYKSNGIYCSQCEAQGFRKITPFLDRPDIMAVYSCTIIADKRECPVLLSNGNLAAAGDLGENRHYVRWEDPHKKPSYLFALVAGNLCNIQDTFITRTGRKVDLKIFSEQENIDKCHHAMACLKQAMRWDENRFNLQYDLDTYQIVAINDFNAGAMENKGLNIFNARYVLADPETATDEDFMNIQRVIGHEYFHNWTGNRVTLKNWFQLSLKEGLTVFRDQEFSSDLHSRPVERIANVKKLRTFQFPEDSGPMAHPVRPESYIKMDNFYTMTVYEKGAELVRMVHQLLGETRFQKGLSLYFERFDGMAVTIEDFLDVMAQVSQMDLSQFKLWYTQSGTPEVTMKRDYDPDFRKLAVTISQKTRPDRNQDIKSPLHIPVQFGLIDAQGNDVTPTANTLLQLKTHTQTFVFENMDPGTLPSVFRQFSAPVRLVTDFLDEEIAFLMAHDTDEFNRWDAAQMLFVKEIQRLVSDIQNNKTPNISRNLVQAFKTALSDPKADKAFIAKTLALPQETVLAGYFETIDVNAIHTARTFLKRYLAKTLTPLFMETIEKCSKSDPNSISRNNMADRSLKNLALSYIGSLGTKETNDLVFNEFMTAANMTDEFAAFRILSHTNETLKQKSADHFYTKWSHDKLVLDKWFQVQACSTLPGTTQKVAALLAHPAFTHTNPNKVRALIYGFAMQNPVHFHQKNGQGYALITRQIIELDRINQQIAARLSTCFNLWKKYDHARRKLMKQALETLMADQSLSKNVYEIVSRALD